MKDETNTIPNTKTKIIRTSTVPLSLKMFCKEILCEMQHDYDVLAVSSSGKELDQLREAGLPVKAIEMHREISLLADLRSLVALTRLLVKEKPYIVHSITPKAGLLTMMAARLAGVKVRIHSFTGLLFPTATGLKRLILKTTDRLTCACATHILPEGQGVKRDLTDAKITGKPLKVLGNGNLRGIDMEYFVIDEQVAAAAQRLRTQFGIPDGAFVFIFVGRIVNDKGITELIEAFRRLVSKHPNSHLLLIGEEEPTGDALRPSTVEMISTTPNIHRNEGWVDDVRPYYAMSDALVFPSYREGFPNVVLEAGAMHLPAIVTDINGSNEIITHAYNGDIIPTKDSESLYNSMLRYIEDPAYLHRLSERCRANIAAKFDARYVRQCLKDFYKSLLPTPTTNSRG